MRILGARLQQVRDMRREVGAIGAGAEVGPTRGATASVSMYSDGIASFLVDDW